MMSVFKIIFKSGFLLSVTLGLSLYFSKAFSPLSNNLKTAYLSVPENTLDVVVLGSSHTQYGINPAVINNETGLYAYINASACQPMEVSYQMLKESLKTQKPKVVLLDVFTMMPGQSVCYDESIYKLASDEMTGIEKINTLLYIEDKKIAFDYIISIRMYHQRWNEIDFNDLKIRNEDIPYDSFGYINLEPKEYVFKYLEPKSKKNKYELKEKDVKSLNKIKALCDENNIELLLIKTPFDIDQENYDALMAIWDLADDLDIEYLDLIDYTEEMDFAFGMDSETWHNTNWGAYKNSKLISEYLIKNYKFEHVYNEEVERNLNYLKNTTLYNMLLNQVDPYKFMKYASEFDCIILLKYNGFYKTTIGEYENELLNNMGFENDFIKNKKNNYYGVVSNGELIDFDDKELITRVNGKKIVINKNKIEFNNQILKDADGELTIVVYGIDFSWNQNMNVDYSSRWFWKNGCLGWECK